MSEDNGKKSEDFDFDFNSLADEGMPQNDAPDDGIFSGLAPEAEEPAGASDGLDSFLTGLVPEEPIAEGDAESTEGSTEESTAESAENTETITEETEVPPVIEADKGKKSKKQKKEKPKKEKKQKTPSAKAPLGFDGILCLLFVLLLLGALVAYNVFIVMNPLKDVGFNSTIYYLVGVDIFGLFGIFVPIGFFASRETSGKELAPESKTEVFKVALGVSTIAVSVGAILLLSELYFYDFEMKPATGVPSVSIPSAEPNLNP